MSKTQDRLQELARLLTKDGALENFVCGLINEFVHDEDFVEAFYRLADEELNPA